MPSTTTTESHSLTYPAEGATGWYATWETLAQQITDYLDDINDIRIATIKDNNGNEAVVINTTASAVNHLEVTNAATGNNPMLSSDGSDSDVGLILGDSNDNEILILESTASAVNEVTITNKATGVNPTIQSTGESNIGLDLLDSNGNELLDLVSVASAVNEVKITNAATGNPALIEAGGETNVGIDIKSKGTGALGLFTNGNEALNIDQNGIITMPLQSAFLAYNSVEDSNATGNGTTATVEFDTEVYDRNSDFDNSTDTFTAPVTGIYEFKVGLFLGGITSSATQILVTLDTNGTDHILYQGDPREDSSGNVIFTASKEISLTAADTAKITVRVNGEASDVVDIKANNQDTFFSGRLLI